MLKRNNRYFRLSYIEVLDNQLLNQNNHYYIPSDILEIFIGPTMVTYRTVMPR